MSIRYIILPILIIILFNSALTLGQSVKNDTTLANSTLANSTNLSSTESKAPPSASTENATTNTSSPNLKYIWRITGVDKDPIIMALDQDGSDLFGQAKYEPDSGEAWNGIVDGSISGKDVTLTITAQKGTSLESIKLKGTYVDDALSGKFTRISEGKITARGDFSAVWISTDISKYTPAKVIEAAATQPKATTTVASNAPTNNTASTTGQTSTGYTPEGLQTGPTQPSVQLGGKTKYVDVHEYADKIGPGGDLSGVPPGMGGGALGGD